MKNNYIVSGYRNIWIPEMRRLFLAEPYVQHVLEKSGEIQKYEEVSVAPYARQSREDLKLGHDFVDQKYNKYVPILAGRLNEIHNKDYDVFFWKKCLSLGLLRYITFLYEIFHVAETQFSLEEHDCRILSQQSYYIPTDFEDHRQFFQHTDYGQEQLFSIYMNLFFPDRFETLYENYVFQTQKGNERSSLIDRLRNVTTQKIISRVLEKMSSLREPKVGILLCYFSAKHLNEIIIRSKGRIRPISLKTDFVFDETTNDTKRRFLSKIGDGFDKFDRFFFYSLQYCLPKILVEHFDQVVSRYEKDFVRFKDLKFVVSEVWISHTYASIALAVLQKRGIEHIYNEHNYLGHQYLGCNQKYIAELCDRYVTLGWYDETFPNLVRGASLFEWVLKDKYKKSIDILYVNAPAIVKREELNAAYGLTAESAIRYLNFIKTFFESLNNYTKNRIVFRGYPELMSKKWLVYDAQYLLKNHISELRYIDTESRSAKVLMLKSKLVIVDYQSTSHIESMMMNIPTIFFWDQNSYFLDNDYKDFYAGFISTGICQTDPIEAAKFVEQVKDNPDEWWQSEKVQEAKNKFLSQNIGDPQIMTDYLIKLSVAPC